MEVWNCAGTGGGAVTAAGGSMALDGKRERGWLRVRAVACEVCAAGARCKRA